MKKKQAPIEMTPRNRIFLEMGCYIHHFAYLMHEIRSFIRQCKMRKEMKPLPGSLERLTAKTLLKRISDAYTELNAKDKKGEDYLEKLIKKLDVLRQNQNTLANGLIIMPHDDEPEGDFFILHEGGQHIGYQTSINHIRKEYLAISQIAQAFAHAGSKISKGQTIATSLRSVAEYNEPIQRLKSIFPTKSHSRRAGRSGKRIELPKKSKREKEQIERSTAEYFLPLYNEKKGTQFEIIEHTDNPDIKCKDSQTGEVLNLEITLLEDRPGDIPYILGRRKKGTGVKCFITDTLVQFKNRIDSKMNKDYGSNTALVLQQVNPLWSVTEWKMYRKYFEASIPTNCEEIYSKGIWVLTWEDNLFREKRTVIQLRPANTAEM